MKVRFICLFLLIAVSTSCAYQMTILHTSDIHGRFNEIDEKGGTCTTVLKKAGKCVGGFARLAYTIKKFRKTRSWFTHVLYLDAGDVFIDTNWFRLQYYKIAAKMMNELKPDAQCLGQHDFDLGKEKLFKYMSQCNSQFIVSNLDISKVKNHNKLKKYTSFGYGWGKIAIVGYMAPQTSQTAPETEGCLFEDEVQALDKLTKQLDVQGYKIIIALGHSGYEMDQKIAAEVEHVDIVVGGHSHTFLYNGSSPSSDKPEGEYPKIVVQKNGKKVPVVEAYQFGKYLGCLNVSFDENGNITEFSGQPIYMSPNVPEDKYVLHELSRYEGKLSKLDNMVIGRVLVVLSGDLDTCYLAECNVGNLVTDAFVSYVSRFSDTRHWTDAPISLMHAAAFGRSVDSSSSGGNVTRHNLLKILLRDYSLAMFSIKGQDLVKTLEHGVRGNCTIKRRAFLQVSGLIIRYNLSKPAGERVESVRVRCGECAVLKYEPLVGTKVYNIVTNTFILDGGYGHSLLKSRHFNKRILEMTAFDMLSEYVLYHSPVVQGLDGRITIFENSATINLPFSIITFLYYHFCASVIILV